MAHTNDRERLHEDSKEKSGSQGETAAQREGIGELPQRGAVVSCAKNVLIDEVDLALRRDPQGFLGEQVHGAKHASGELVEKCESFHVEEISLRSGLGEPVPDIGGGGVHRGGLNLDLGGEPGEQRAMDPQLKARVQLGQSDKDK